MTKKEKGCAEGKEENKGKSWFMTWLVIHLSLSSISIGPFRSEYVGKKGGKRDENATSRLMYSFSSSTGTRIRGGVGK